ncbi:GvpL/GvpF family gas vesicle protein [Streptomyces macrosporus]|uniref:GvpL/GvpF family gas vesicle protein n=1 Tax=Streptomyces macrosporus TaxID=44032 RepID=A0ABP5XAF0_9ACTN
MTVPGVYVYGVVRSDHPEPTGRPGVGSPPRPVRTLRTSGLAAVVSDAPEGLRARRRDLMAHQNLLLTLAADGPVLPMRFGVVAPDEDSLARRLEPPESRLAALERLEGRVEMNLKAMPAEDALEELVREDARVRRLREAARRAPGYEASVRLGEAVAAGLDRRAREAARRVVDDLSALADATAHGSRTPGCVANVSFLVPRVRLGRFADAVEELAVRHRHRVVLRPTGPLPCYSFVDDATAPRPVRVEA